ncbi:MAG TPA: hydantoinase/oxoprolinase family protein [Syntrophales bacterium]|nr:hydantoinase/oxoprolinase family protein [Syntrophales bacterium]
MILGIDVGGTHTDAVLLDHFQVKKKTKVPTNQLHLVVSLIGVMDEILRGEDLAAIERVVFSTTISTNAIVQGKTDRVGMIVASGPGLAPEALSVNEDTRFVSGYMSNRGIEVAPVKKGEIAAAVSELKGAGIGHLGVVGKFSTRNPAHENEIGEVARGDFRHVSLGHRMSGNLNFRRRIATTYLNASIFDLYSRFVGEILDFAARTGLAAPIYILKADGGTIEIRQSADQPVQTILSGPAASIMGILSLADCSGSDAIAMDMGGTTTDIALLADGVPLLEPLGVTIEGHRTLIRGLKTKSIGLGGDSRVRVDKGEILIGPRREGPAAAFGGPFPTPTDAMIVLGLTEIGDRAKAEEALSEIAGKMNTTVPEAARLIFEKTCQGVASAVTAMIDEINNKPVYTIHELLEGKKLAPARLFIVGGPAAAVAPRLGEILGCRVVIPQDAEVANAFGAALARTTAEVTLLAETERGSLTIAEEGLQMKIPVHFTRKDILKIGMEKLRERARKLGARDADIEMEIVEDQEFNMVRGFYATGKNIRLKAQVKPGLIAGFGKGGARS